MASFRTLEVRSALLAIIAFALSGCGGGSSDSSTAPPATPTISGVAASGAPMANASITITCADATTKTGTADANGAFSIDVTGCSGPYIVTASTQTGDATQTLVSVYPTTTTTGVTVNVTPFTNAIAATLASDGQPATLATNIATEKANITANAVADRNSALAAALSPALTQAGVTGSVDLIGSQFNANRAGIDKIIDNIKVVVTPSGVSITNVGGAKVDDMGDMSGKTAATDLSAAAITISRTTDFKTALTQIPNTVDDMSTADAAQAALNACFAVPAAQRGKFGAAAGACNALPVASDYLHDGKNGTQEFDHYLTSANYDNAKFAKPEIIRFYSNTATDARALVRFGLMRSDGVGEFLVTVVEKSASTGSAWQIRGNRRQYRLFVNGYVVREEQLASRGTPTVTRPKGDYLLTGINLVFGYLEGNAGGAVTSSSGPARGTGRAVSYVKVTGPGLPSGGIVLNPLLSGCDGYFAVAASSTATPGSCTSAFKMQYRKATANDSDNSTVQGSFGSTASPDFAAAQSTDAALQAIQPFSAYQFQIFNTGNATTTPNLVYVERMRSRPIALGTTPGSGEVDKLVFNTGLSDETKNFINPTSTAPFTGGSTFTVKWTNVANAPPIGSLQVQSRPTGGATGALFQDETNVSFKTVSATLNNQGVAWGDMSKATTSGNFNFVSLRTRDSNDTQYFQNWRY